MRQDIASVADNGDVALSREPIQIGEIFVEGVPIAPEVRWEGEGARPFGQERLLNLAVMTSDTTDDCSLPL